MKNEQKERRIQHLIFLCETALTSYYDSDIVYLVIICLKIVSSFEKYHPIILKNTIMMANLMKIDLN